MRFRFTEEHRCSFPANRLCEIVGVSSRGLRAFRSRPASRRQRSDMVTLAHIKEQSRLSAEGYELSRWVHTVNHSSQFVQQSHPDGPTANQALTLNVDYSFGAAHAVLLKQPKLRSRSSVGYARVNRIFVMGLIL